MEIKYDYVSKRVDRVVRCSMQRQAKRMSFIFFLTFVEDSN